MENRDFQAELAVKIIEFELALNNGLPHAKLIKIYRELKELQYQRLVTEVQDRKSLQKEIIE